MLKSLFILRKVPRDRIPPKTPELAPREQLMSEIRSQTKKLSSNKSVPTKPPLKPELSTRELLMNQIKNNPKVLKADEPVTLSSVSNKSPRSFLPAQNKKTAQIQSHNSTPITPPPNFNLSQPGLYSAKTFQAQNNNNNNTGEGRCDLLADIRKGIKLRNVSEASN